jgi:hypothetical protein
LEKNTCSSRNARKETWDERMVEEKQTELLKDLGNKTALPAWSGWTVTWKRREPFFFLEVLGFELRSLHLLGRCSTAWTMPTTLSTLVILELGLLFAQWSLYYNSSIMGFPPYLDNRPAPHPVEIRSVKHFFGRVWEIWNCDPPDLSLSNSWDYKNESLVLSRNELLSLI